MACDFRKLLVFFGLLITVATMGGSGAVAANDSTTGVLDLLKPALEQAEKGGATVIVVGPGNGQAGSKDADLVANASIPDMLMRARFRFGLVWRGAGDALSHMRETLARGSPDGRANWLVYAIIVGLIAVVIGRLVARPVANWSRDTFAPHVSDVPEHRSEKIGYLLFRGLMFFVMAAISAVVGTLIIVVYAGDHEPARITGLAIVLTYAAYRCLRAVYINFLMPNVPVYRVINMGDADAGSLYRALLIGSGISVAVLGLCIWMDMLGLDINTHKLALLSGSLSAAVILAVIAVVYRVQVAQAILGVGAAEDKPYWLRTLAKIWHVLLILYVAFAWLVSAVRLLLDQPGAIGLVGAPLLVLVLGLTVYGIALIAIDQFFEKRPAVRAKTVEQPHATAETLGEEDAGQDTPPAEDVAGAQPDVAPAAVPVFKGLAEHAAAVLLTIAGAGYIAAVWGVDLNDPKSWVSGSLDIAIVIFLAYLAYRAVQIWIDTRIAEEEPAHDAHGASEGGGAGASQLATLLPIFRNFLLITIAVIAAMITLSEIGVDIAPLFAGAGVVGLAIGFGAQTLIRDIFSGAFFLVDDAFRMGEYIDIGSAKGKVEKISFRSFQLRHHNGPLNTVPFGEIKQLTNYSRDWAIMKLELRLTYDTDAEMVRKMIKKLGQELLEHPEIGDMFLQPLKSQGVKAMEDSAMIMRVKFTTKPGDQFTIRRYVLAEIRELFAANGIKFAHREVTVRVADSDNPLTDTEKQAVAGAVTPALEQPVGAAPPADNR